MNALTEKLIMALEKDCEIYEEVLRLGEEKKQIIINGDIETLEKITKREHALIASLMKLEGIRDKIVAEIMREKGMVSANVIDDVIKVIDQDAQEKLQFVKRKLGNLMTDVKDVNASNGELLKQSLEIVDFNVNLMTSMNETETNYGGKANINYEKNKRNAFDAKV